MGNITVKKENGPRAQIATAMPTTEWEPARWMRGLLSWDPFREMAPFPAIEERFTFAPAFEVKENKDGYVFKADVPGVKDKDLEVTVTGNRLTVGGKRENEVEDKGDTYYTYERTYGSFSRSFTLPEGADVGNVYADLKEGVLTLTVPRLPETQPKKIEVKTPATKS
jgi:HSP20 family protein